MKISIVIPTYNRPALLDRLLESIQSQTFKDFEVIIIDDNSSNQCEYEAVMNKYKNVFKEMQYHRNEKNSGAPYSRNRGIRLAAYELVALVDDDDKWLPNKLAWQNEVYEHSSDKLGIVYTWTDAIDEKGEVVYRYRSEIEGNAKVEILRECFIPSPSVLVRKSALLEAGLFDETMPSCQDWDMWTRIFLKEYTCRVVKSVEALHWHHHGPTIGKSQRAFQGYNKYYKKFLREAFVCDKGLFLEYIYRILKIEIDQIVKQR